MNKKLIFGIGGVLVLALVLLLGYRLGVRKGASTNPANGEVTAAAEVQNTAPGQRKIVVKGNAEKKLKLELVTGNSWEADGGHAVQIDATITNEGTEEVSDWTAELTVPQGTKVVQGWNGSYEVKGTSLDVKPADYNKSIPAGQNVTFGLIINSSQKDFQAKQGTVSVGGTKVGETGVSASAQNQMDVEDEEPQGETEDAGLLKVSYKKESNPVKKHGKLKVKGTALVDCHGKRFQLRGISTHGIAWFPQYVSKSSFASLKKLYGINAVRLALYSDPGAGYQRSWHKTVRKGVKAATQLGLYVIIDWHILGDGNPNQHKKQAKSFFQEMTKRYRKQKNVLYEICNEPNGNVTWQKDVKPYANGMIKTIRKRDKDAVIIVGTPTWSQDVDIAADDPIRNRKNIMYALHFYAATHKDDLRQKAKTALGKGLPIFVSEFSICDASGAGGIDYASANAWRSFLNKHKISMMAWSLCNKNETSALLKPDCAKTSGYTKKDLSQTGKWLWKSYRKK